MLLLFLFLGLLFLSLLGRAESFKAMSGTQKCDKQHSWVLRTNLEDDKRCYLICKVCGKIPGDDA